MKEKFLFLTIFLDITLAHRHDGENHDHQHGDGGLVKDYDRACPEGFFYAGEVDTFGEMTRGEHWIDGGATPVYSCYKTIYGDFDWVQASSKCSDIDGQLLSVNNYKEEDILGGQLFINKAFSSDISENEGVGPVLTSGVSLEPGNWTWFGAGEPMSDNQTEMLNELMESENISMEATMCAFLQWDKDSEEVSFDVLPCMGQYNIAICEVRAYTQTWFVWFSINWLQVLFLFTLILLIISSCVTMQVWTSRPSRRPQVPRHGMTNTRGSPPPYSPTPETVVTGSNNNNNTGFANKYTEKGKEILAKVIYYRKPEDKQKLTEA